MIDDDDQNSGNGNAHENTSDDCEIVRLTVIGVADNNGNNT